MYLLYAIKNVICKNTKGMGESRKKDKCKELEVAKQRACSRSTCGEIWAEFRVPVSTSREVRR